MKKIALAIGAHPDDIEIGCGGTLCLLHDQGYEISHVIVTSGEEGSLKSTKEELRQLRKAEARKSAEVIGSQKVIFFDAPDGLTSFTKELKVHLITLIREIRPDIVFTHAQSDHFPDHALVHKLSMAAITASGGPWYPDGGIVPHQVQKVFGYEVWNPISNFQTAINIEFSIDRKLEALKQHSSQIEDINYLKAIAGLAQYRGVMSMSGAYAEVFETLKTGSVL